MGMASREDPIQGKAASVLDPAALVSNVSDPFVVVRIRIQIEQPQADPDAQRSEHQRRGPREQVEGSLRFSRLAFADNPRRRAACEKARCLFSQESCDLRQASPYTSAAPVAGANVVRSGSGCFRGPSDAEKRTPENVGVLESGRPGRTRDVQLWEAKERFRASFGNVETTLMVQALEPLLSILKRPEESRPKPKKPGSV